MCNRTLTTAESNMQLSTAACELTDLFVLLRQAKVPVTIEQLSNKTPPNTKPTIALNRRSGSC